MRANVADLERRAAAPGRDARRERPRPRPSRCSASGSRCRWSSRRSGWAGCSRRRAEVQAARAAEAAGVPFVESTVSICTIEEVAEATRTPPWFQLYVMRDRGYAEDLMARARAVGCAGPDAHRRPRRGRRAPPRHPQRHGRRPGARGPRLRRGLDLVSHPRLDPATSPLGGKPLTFGNLEKAVPGAPARRRRSGTGSTSQFDPSVTWDDIAWVREHWHGRLVVKGVLDPEDARRAADAGVDGIVVSNHGGRQLDSVPSTARALPAVVDAVGDEVEVLADGGVRTGLDVVKMVALGARAVLIGRAWAWAVAARGEAGVRHVLEVHEGRHRHRARPHRHHRRRRTSAPTCWSPAPTSRPRAGSAAPPWVPPPFRAHPKVSPKGSAALRCQRCGWSYGPGGCRR